MLGDHLWVQYCHSGFEVKADPEYVFALNPERPRLGLFVPFYMYFLRQWSDPCHARYDFDTRDLVYSDGQDREIRRTRLAGGRSGTPALLNPQHAATGGTDENRKLETGA